MTYTRALIVAGFVAVVPICALTGSIVGNASTAPSGTLKVGTTLSNFDGETRQEAYDRRTAQFGEPESVRVFETDDPAWVNYGNALEVMSFKFLPAEVLAGQHDAELKALFASTPVDGERHPWVYWHEPENDAFSAESFRLATEYVGRIADQYDTPQTKLAQGVILMGWTVQAGSGRNVVDYLPQTGYKVDWLGWDVYTSGGDGTREEYGLAAQASVANGYKRYYITETGLHNPETYTADQHAAFILESTQIAADYGFRVFTYFDSTNGGDWLIDTPVETDAMREALVRDLAVARS